MTTPEPETLPDPPVVHPPDGPPPVEPGSPDGPEPRETPPAGLDRRGRVERTRSGVLWAGLVTAAVLAVALLIFIAQNSDKVTLKFLGFEGRVSLAIALLSAAVLGVLIVAVPGTVRILQLRHALRKNNKVDKKSVKGKH